MKTNKNFLLTVILVALSFILCACSTNKAEKDIAKENSYVPQKEIATQQAPIETQEPQADKIVVTSNNPAVEHENSLDIKTDSPVLESNATKESKESTTEPQSLTCTVMVRCDAILANLDKLDKSKYNLVPDNGIIFSSQTVEFCEGENAFNVLLREMNKNNIHMEFEYTPDFNSYYVEGIGNLYEFDCGDMSGWIYKINGKIATVSCSQYMLKPGDVIEWVYTCGF